MEQYSGRENTYKFFLGERDRYREKGRQGYREEKREIKGSRKKRYFFSGPATKALP